MKYFQHIIACGLLIAFQTSASGESGKKMDNARIEQPKLCLVHKEQLTFSKFNRIPEIADLHFPKMHKALEESGLKKNGPNIFLYEFSDDPHGPDIPEGKFTLTIAIPVEGKAKASKEYATAEIPAFKYVSITKSGFTWQEARDNAEQKGMKRSLVEREVYHKWKGLGSMENQIEHQVGVE